MGSLPGEDLCKSFLENSNVVVNQSLLLCRAVFAHQADESEIPALLLESTGAVY